MSAASKGGATTATAVAVKAHIAQRCEGPKGRAATKKKARRTPTRLPTKRMATACWAFIVAKSTAPKAAPMLDFCSLQRANKKFYPHIINKALWTEWGYSCSV
jgi:hypothetical protein